MEPAAGRVAVAAVCVLRAFGPEDVLADCGCWQQPAWTDFWEGRRLPPE